MNSVNKKKVLIARCGLRTNGDIHVGNMLPILTGFIIGKNLSKEGKKLKFVIMLVDLEQSKNRKPFIYESDEENCHNSLSEHNEEIIKFFISEISKLYPETEVVLCKVSKFIQIKSVKNKIIELYKEKFYKNMISIVCKKCHRVAKILEISDNIKYICPFCGMGDVQLNLSEFALEHTFLGALENYYFRPEIHIIGRDHLVRNGGHSNIEKGNLYLSKMLSKKIFTKKILTPLVLSKNNKKMSKSEKAGLFSSELKRKYGKGYIKKIIKIGEYCFVKKIKLIDYKKLQKLLD